MKYPADIDNLDDDLKSRVLEKMGKFTDKQVARHPKNWNPKAKELNENEEELRGKAQKYMKQGEAEQQKRDATPPKEKEEDEEEDEDDDDEMPPLKPQDGTPTAPARQPQKTAKKGKPEPKQEETEDGEDQDQDQDTQALFDKMKQNVLQGDTAGDPKDVDLAPKGTTQTTEPDFEDDFEDQQQGLLDKMLGKSPKSKFVGTEQDSVSDMNRADDLARAKAEDKAYRLKNATKATEEPTPKPETEENPFLFDKSLLSEPQPTSAQASQDFVKQLTGNPDYIPPSQQTAGEDATQIGDEAGYNRGSQKIPAKKETLEDDDLDEDEEIPNYLKAPTQDTKYTPAQPAEPNYADPNEFPPPPPDVLKDPAPEPTQLTPKETNIPEPSQPPPPQLIPKETDTAEPQTASNEIDTADKNAQDVTDYNKKLTQDAQTQSTDDPIEDDAGDGEEGEDAVADWLPIGGTSPRGKQDPLNLQSYSYPLSSVLTRPSGSSLR